MSEERMRLITIRLPPSLVAAIDSIGKGDGLSKAPIRSDTIRELLAKQVRSEKRRTAR